MKLFCWKILSVCLLLSLFLQVCLGQWSKFNNPAEEEEAEKNQEKEPFRFNEMEMTAIDAMLAFRSVLGEVIQKIAIAWPALASIVTRSDSNSVIPLAATSITKKQSVPNPTEALASTAMKSSGLGSTLIKGMAFTLPLLLPMAAMRRMSSSPGIYAGPPYNIPFLPDPYYNVALHRRRGRSMLEANKLSKHASLESIVSTIDDLSRKYQRLQQLQQQIKRRSNN